MSRRESTFRGLAVFALAWQTLWLVGDATLRSIVLSNPAEPAVVILALSMVSGLVTLPFLFGSLRDERRARVAQIVAMALVVIAGLALLSNTSAVGDDGWFVGASVLNLGAGLAGLYLDRRLGIALVASIVAAEVLVVLVVYTRGFDAWPIEVDLVYPFYALALGLACVAARHALMASARRQDEAQEQLTRQRTARMTNELTDASLTVAETRLHETVLNTLTAIVRGGLPDDDATRDRLRDRARESADVLRSIADGADVAARWVGDLRVDLAGAIVDLENSGTDVQLLGVLDSQALGSSIDSGAFAAMGSAVREALINVMRHASATQVHIMGEVLRDRRGSWWRVRITDDGTGFDARKRGYGLRSVIEEGLVAYGGRASISSRPGTVITCDVPVDGSPSGNPSSAGGPTQAIALPVVTAFTAFTLYVIGATWQYVSLPAANIGAAAVFAIAVVAIVVSVRDRGTRPLSGPVAVLVLIAVPLMTHIESLVAARPNPTGDWTSEAGAALMFVIVATGPAWVAPLAVASWLLAQEVRLIELTQPGMFVIVVAALLGWQLRRGEARARGVDVEAVEARTALAASQQRLAQAKRRYQDVDTAGLIALLDALADGRVDPTDRQIRQACIREERMIRSVLHLHPESVAVHRDLVALAVAARDGDLDLSIAVVEDIPADASLACVDDALELLVHARQGSHARVSITRDEHGCVFRLVLQVSNGSLASLPDNCEVLDEDEGLVSLEERCATSRQGDSPSLVSADAPRSGDDSG